MKKKIKRAKEAKARWEQETKGKLESFVKKLSLQWKIRERIDAANAWAVKHPKRTATMTIGALVCSLCLGIVVSLYTPQPSKDIVGGDRECAAYVRRTAEHTERQERTGSRGRTTGSARTAAEMGTGFLGAYSYQDASGFHAYHL